MTGSGTGSDYPAGMAYTFGRLLAQGTCYTAAIQLTSVSTVLPYIGTEFGGPTLAVALLVPISFACSLCGTLYAPRILRWVVSTTVLLAAIAVLQALLTVTNASGLVLLPAPFSVYLIVAVAGIIGVVTGFSNVGYPLAISALLSDQRRNDLILRQTGLAAILMMVVSAYSVYFLAHTGSGLDDVMMLWVGALVMALAAVFGLALRPAAELGQARSVGLRTVLADGLAYLRQQPWFRRYLSTQLVFMAITLGPMFYGIYISKTLGLYNGCLDGILLFMGIGLLMGTVVWTKIRKRFSTTGMYVGSALLSFAAATLCIVSLTFDLMPAMLTFELTMLLAAMANQAVFPAGLDWIYREATEDVRVVVIMFSQLVVGVAVILIGFALGVLAGQAPATWPLAIIISGAAIALLAARRVPHVVPARGTRELGWLQ